MIALNIYRKVRPLHRSRFHSIRISDASSTHANSHSVDLVTLSQTVR